MTKQNADSDKPKRPPGRPKSEDPTEAIAIRLPASRMRELERLAKGAGVSPRTYLQIKAAEILAPRAEA